jgi:hypothetical protein
MSAGVHFGLATSRAIATFSLKSSGKSDSLLSRQRSIIETINDQLKNISQIEHSRHRAVKRISSSSNLER